MEGKIQPLVSVIVTAYNHELYIQDALISVFQQTYRRIEVIVIENGSTDKTRGILECQQEILPYFRLIKNSDNLGLCRAFNQGLAIAGGKYIIDLSGDDLMLPERIARQVAAFEALDESYGVIFSNALYINAEGSELRKHFAVGRNGQSVKKVPSGDVYKDILKKYFICTPTMMIRASILHALGGYDESLSFEDFDFWVRSAVQFKYFYQDEILTKKRLLPKSLSSQVYLKGSGMLASYYVVCNKAYDLNRDQKEFDLLADRIRTFIRKCLYAQEFELAVRFRKLLNFIENPGWGTELIVLLCKLHLPVNFAYRFYIKNLKKAFRQEGFSF